MAEREPLTDEHVREAVARADLGVEYVAEVEPVEFAERRADFDAWLTAHDVELLESLADRWDDLVTGLVALGVTALGVAEILRELARQFETDSFMLEEPEPEP